MKKERQEGIICRDSWEGQRGVWKGWGECLCEKRKVVRGCVVREGGRGCVNSGRWGCVERERGKGLLKREKEGGRSVWTEGGRKRGVCVPREREGEGVWRKTEECRVCGERKREEVGGMWIDIEGVGV